ncbi:MAG: ATP-binding protein [Phocaeicola sp.]
MRQLLCNTAFISTPSSEGIFLGVGELTIITLILLAVGAIGAIAIRKAITKSKEESTNQLLKLLDKLNIPVALKNLETGRYSYTNLISTKLYGTKKGEKPSYKVLQSTLDREIEGGEYEGSEQLLLADGRVVESEVKSIPTTYQEAKHALILRNDCTEYNQMKNKLKLFSEFMPVLKAYLWSYNTNENYFTVQHNTDLKYGVDGKQTPEKFLDNIHPEDRDYILGKIEQMRKSSENVLASMEFRMDVKYTGEYEWWESNHYIELKRDKGRECRLVHGITTNIHQRKRAEMELKTRNHDIELILNNINSLLVYVTDDLKVIWSNAETALNGRMKEFYSKGTQCCFGNGCLLKGGAGDCTVCPTRLTFEHGEMHSKEKEVEEGVWLKTTVLPVMSEEGKSCGAILKIDDVSDYNRLINELKITTAKAEESDKLKSAFLANMSHEIRTPLNAIVGFSELLQESDCPEERKEYSEIINRNNDSLLKLIGDVLDLSKIESGLVELHPEEFDLNLFFQEFHATFKGRYESNERSFEVSIPKESCLVKLDRNKVLQVVTNYCENAIKFTPKGKIQIGYDSNPEGILLFVKDTGVGIAADKAERLFGRFEKLNETAQGTGLGLSICRAIAEAMGGKTWADSQEGVGSTFYLFLPHQVEKGASHCII